MLEPLPNHLAVSCIAAIAAFVINFTATLPVFLVDVMVALGFPDINRHCEIFLFCMWVLSFGLMSVSFALGGNVSKDIQACAIPYAPKLPFLLVLIQRDADGRVIPVHSE